MGIPRTAEPGIGIQPPAIVTSGILLGNDAAAASLVTPVGSMETRNTHAANLPEPIKAHRIPEIWVLRGPRPGEVAQLRVLADALRQQLGWNVVEKQVFTGDPVEASGKQGFGWDPSRNPSLQIGRAVQQECRDRSRMPSSA
eukprot:TRINITY_DN65931_c0_g1_i1.p1 TRINITY_DN65931_c0_g1~~TRINITY_DN65931_c0_g1_i1.p1  ORF type:complete len:142 (+),score=32.88 TRINITY_DN65931_c0_g1_i1:48-473(+)